LTGVAPLIAVRHRFNFEDGNLVFITSSIYFATAGNIYELMGVLSQGFMLCMEFYYFILDGTNANYIPLCCNPVADWRL
jgi:hypothetical protein